jgi:flagellar basal-body rod modification protein FlgD
MEITGFGISGQSSQGQSASRNTLSDTFDNFLTLLTKQLQYQDPMSPMDTNEFTAQLVQYTEVEQSISTNEKLEDLLAMQSASQAMNAMSFLGTTVEAQTSSIALSNGSATFEYEMSTPTAGTSVVILNADGKPVRVLQGERAAGSHSVTWDGKDADGKALADGVYSVQVQGKDAKGETVQFTTRAVGRVTGVEVRDGTVLLSIGELQVALESVHAVRPSDPQS